MAGGRPPVYATAEQRRQAKRASQLRWKDKKRLQDKLQISGQSNIHSPNALPPITIEPTLAAPSELYEAAPPISLRPDPLLPHILPQRVPQHITRIQDRLITLERRFQTWRGALLEPDWAKIQVDTAEMDLADGRALDCVTELKMRLKKLAELEEMALAGYLDIAELDPGLQHPLSHRFGVVFTSIKRARVTLQELRTSLKSPASTVFLRMRGDGLFLVNRVWGYNPTCSDIGHPPEQPTSSVHSESSYSPSPDP